MEGVKIDTCHFQYSV